MRYLVAFAALWSATQFRADPKDPSPPGAGEVKTLAGFKAEVVYRVPRGQGSWVCMTCDPKGRLVASDQYGGLYRVTLPAAGRPVRVERLGTDLGSAQGLAFAFDGLYAVVNKKDGSGLYRARDTDGDDTFDEVKLLRRFDGDGEHGPHAVVPGPDGKSLYVVGGNGTRLPAVGRSLVPRNWAADELLPPVGQTDGAFTREMPGGWVVRTDPDGKAFDLVAIGLRNAYDLAFDRDGELFTYDSDMEWDMGTPWYRPTRVCHLTSGAEFGWRTGTNKWPDYYPDSLPAVADIGAGSPTGVSFGYGLTFPAKYQRALFVGDWSYGRVYAVHLEPRGSSYTGTPELFLSGTPLPVTDLVAHPTDGALYFSVGGRGAASAVYRVTYHGGEATTPAAAVRDDAAARARTERRTLESLHGAAADRAITAAWPALAHADRFTRYAARVAVEHQPVARWREKALTESDPRARVAALVALTRCGDRADGPAVVESLGGVRWDRLDEDGRLDLVRAYTLAFIRLGDPDKKARAAAVAHLDRHYPADSDRLNRELCPLLVSLDAPGVVGRTLDLLARAPTQEEQLFYVMTLRAAGSDWTPERRTEYFRWFDRAAAIRGGVSFEEYLREIKKAATARLTPAERTALGDLLAEKPRKDPYAALKARPVVREWKVDDLLAAADAKAAKRDVANGRRVFAEARCFGCHRFDGRGGMTGPDLTGVAGRYDTRTLLESLLEPSKVIPDRYAAVRIATLDGRVLTGTVKDLTGDEWTVMTDPLDPAGLVKVRRTDVESVRPSPVSPMPTGLLNAFTEAEVLDLIAYLRSGSTPLRR
jgi:putative heme-binding domain-containing protein